MAKQKQQKTEVSTKVDEINRKVQASEAFLKENLVNWTRYYKLYRGFVDENLWPTKTKIFNPYTFSAIETHTSKSVATKPDGEFMPESDDAKGDPELIGLSFDKWWRLANGTYKSQSAFKKDLMYGSVMTFAFWKFRTGYENGEKEIIDDRPDFEVLRLEDGMCGFDPDADSWQAIRYAWKKSYVSEQEMRDWLEGPEGETFDKEVIKLALTDFSENKFDESVYKTEKARANGNTMQSDQTIKKVECVYIENYDTGDVITLIGRKHIIRDVKNYLPYERSFDFLVDHIVPSEICGMGEIEVVERLQHGINLAQNQRRDNVAAVLSHQWLVEDKAEVDDDELVDELNGIIHTADINGVKPLVKPNVTQNSYQEEASMKQDFQSALAITDASKGNTGDLESAKSGRALQMLQSAADARVQGKLALLEVMLIKPIAEKFQLLAAKYQKDPLTVMQSGKRIKIKPEEFIGIWSYFVESGSTTHTDKTQAKEEYIAYQKEIIELAKLKEAQLQLAQTAGQPQIDPVTGQSTIDPMTGQPVISQTMPIKVLNYDKMAEKLSEKFNVKDWRQIWIVDEQEQVQQQEQGELLPPIDDEEMEEQEQMPEDEQMQESVEMLPSINEEAINNQQPKGEMLPKI